MSDLIDRELIVVRRHGTWVEVEIRTDILFPSGVATLSPPAEQVLTQLAADAAAVPELDPRRRSHRQSADQHDARFRRTGNCRRRVRRASCTCSRARAWIRRGSRSIGLGENRPAQSNATPEGRNANRRVLLVILGSGNRPEGDYAGERGQGEEPPVAEPPTVPAALPQPATCRGVVAEPLRHLRLPAGSRRSGFSPTSAQSRAKARPTGIMRACTSSKPIVSSCAASLSTTPNSSSGW